MIRDCSTFPFLDQKYIRFCFMMPEDNDRLSLCLLENL
jgi:threonine-phosphate decarboxylase